MHGIALTRIVQFSAQPLRLAARNLVRSPRVIPIRYNLRSLMVRRATSVMTAAVVALVVMILFILSGFVAGLRATVLRSAVGDNWIVLSRGTTNEGGSYISRDQYE